MKPISLLSSPCSKCKKQEATHEHHTKFDKKTNKSDKNSPTINVCALCHAKIHGISPNVSELRMLVTEFNRVQKVRIVYDNSMRGFKFIEMKIPEFFQEQSKNLNDYEKSLSKKIKLFLEGKTSCKMKTTTFLSSQTKSETITPMKPMEFLSHKREDHVKYETQRQLVFPIYNWLKSIKGISHLLSAQLIAYIDIDKFDKVSSLWHYVGMHVVGGTAPKRKRGSKIDWNPQLRMICYKISDSFIKQRTPKYRSIYDKEKKRQLKLLRDHGLLDNQLLDVSKRKKGETRIVLKPILSMSSPPKSKLHVENRARRKAVKEFLKDLFLNWKQGEEIFILRRNKNA